MTESWYTVAMGKKKVSAKVAQIQGLRSSSAAGKHGDRRTKRLKTRGARKRKAKEEYGEN